ncbi:unnamed protein product [Haemonchus placei]|uniref:SCP domain-containing protein n=1 Tax=Haemonchus placei TaxID=6290 RepID=A0A0N4X3H9_HAEPC|nr:unnamed protein product [Haemonchus placei]
MNYYTFYETPGNNLNSTIVINLALASWMEEILNTNFGSQVTYTNQTLQEFANMIYYKSTKAGCAYQKCNQPAPPRAVVACIFNSAAASVFAGERVVLFGSASIRKLCQYNVYEFFKQPIREKVAKGDLSTSYGPLPSSLQMFQVMIYYKSTKAGCAYQECNQPAPPRAVVACIFNSAPQLGKPIYPGTQGVNGCNKDSDCSAVISGTTCGPKGLCGYSFSKSFSSK